VFFASVNFANNEFELLLDGKTRFVINWLVVVFRRERFSSFIFNDRADDECEEGSGTDIVVKGFVVIVGGISVDKRFSFIEESLLLVLLLLSSLDGWIECLNKFN